MELTWKASEPASALYAANCLAERQPIADVRLGEAYAPVVAVALGELETCGVPPEPMLAVLAGLAAAGVDDSRQLVEQALRKLAGIGDTANPFIGRLAGAVSGLKSGFQNAHRATAANESSELVDELLLRGRPIFEQWDARGPGMLDQIARSTEERVLVPRADVVLVYPLVGGHGVAHRTVNVVTFEAVLANPVETLPEIVRMAWLLAQLNLDLPIYADHIPAAGRDSVGKLGVVPPVLAAAEYVELASFSVETLRQALTAWRVVGVEVSDPELSALADTLFNWWHTYQEGSTPWAVALAALEQMTIPASATDLDGSGSSPDDTRPEIST
jgi:hypothetical protein